MWAERAIHTLQEDGCELYNQAWLSSKEYEYNSWNSLSLGIDQFTFTERVHSQSSFGSFQPDSSWQNDGTIDEIDDSQRSHENIHNGVIFFAISPQKRGDRQSIT